MGELVNLKRIRKQRARQEDAATAEANRIRFGRSAAERRGTEAEAKRAQRLLDGKRLASARQEKLGPAGRTPRQDRNMPEGEE